MTTDNGKVYFIDLQTGDLYCVKSNASNWRLANTNWECNKVDVLLEESVFPFENTQLKFYNNSIFYVNIDQNIARFYYSNNRWQYQDFQIQVAFPVIEIDNYGKVYYIDSDSKICALWQYNYNSAIGYGPLNPDSITAREGTDLIYFDEQLFFTGSDNLIHVFYYTGCFWQNKIISWDVNPLSDTLTYSPWFAFSVKTDFYNNLFYINSSDRKMHCLSPRIDTSTYPYVYLRGNKFMLNNDEFKMKGVAYLLNINTDLTNDEIKDLHNPNLISWTNNLPGTLNNNRFWISPNTSYEYYNNTYYWEDKVKSIAKINEDFALIKKIGFSTVKIIGLNVDAKYNENTGLCKYLKINVMKNQLQGDDIPFSSSIKIILLGFITQIIDMAGNNGLKAVLNVGNGGTHDPKDTNYRYQFYNYLNNCN